MTNADAINAAARDLAAQGACLPGARVWVCDVVDALSAQNPQTSQQIRDLLVAESRSVVFGTGDLIAAYDQEKVAKSRLRVPGHRCDVLFVYAR